MGGPGTPMGRVPVHPWGRVPCTQGGGPVYPGVVFHEVVHEVVPLVGHEVVPLVTKMVYFWPVLAKNGVFLARFC